MILEQQDCEHKTKHYGNHRRSDGVDQRIGQYVPESLCCENREVIHQSNELLVRREKVPRRKAQVHVVTEHIILEYDEREESGEKEDDCGSDIMP